jgi:hypothetical protein
MGNNSQGVIRKGMPSGNDSMVGNWFSETIMLKQGAEMIRFNLIES